MQFSCCEVLICVHVVRCSCCARVVRRSSSPSLFVSEQRWLPEVSEVSHDWTVKTPSPPKWKLTQRETRSSSDVFWCEIFYRRGPVPNQDRGPQDTKRKEKNALMTEVARICTSVPGTNTWCTKEDLAIVGSDSVVRFDAMMNCVVVLGKAKEGVLCTTDVVRCSFPLGFMCCAHSWCEMLVSDRRRVLCSCCGVLVCSQLLV